MWPLHSMSRDPGRALQRAGTQGTLLKVGMHAGMSEWPSKRDVTVPVS